MEKIIVLGMHRSGTSCATHMLHEAGVDLGEKLLVGAPSNPEGFFESNEVIAINNQILAQSNGGWESPPSRIVANEETIDQLKHWIRNLDEHAISGCKDPRMVLTYPIWKPHLGDHWIVACIRNPFAVAQSLKTRQDCSLEQAYFLWHEYNSRLLHYVQEHDRVLWFDYDRTPNQQRAWLRHACHTLGLEVTPNALKVFDKFQRHHCSASTSNPECDALYSKLQLLSQASWQLSVDPVATPLESEETFDDQIQTLVRLHGHHNELLQRFDGILAQHTGSLNQAGIVQQQLENSFKVACSKLANAEHHNRQLEERFEGIKHQLTTAQDQLGNEQRQLENSLDAADSKLAIAEQRIHNAEANLNLLLETVEDLKRKQIEMFQVKPSLAVRFFSRQRNSFVKRWYSFKKFVRRIDFPSWPPGRRV